MNPRTTRRADYIVLVLTVFAALPYENGVMTTLIPPAAKPWVIFAGLIAKLVLGEMKTQQTPSQTEMDTKQNKLP